MIEELAAPWTARCESALQERRGGPRRRAAGASPNHQLVFTDRVLVTLVVLRLQLPHAALAVLYRVSRPTVTRAVHEIRPLLARRGFAVPDRPGRQHDQTAMRTEGIAEQLRLHPQVRAEVDEGYRGLANEFPDQVSAPPRKPKDDVPLGDQHAWREARRRQSSQRICVEHAIGEQKKWRPLQRYIGRREHYTEIHAAVASLVSDRAARRPTRRRTSTELVLVGQAPC